MGATLCFLLLTLVALLYIIGCMREKILSALLVPFILSGCVAAEQSPDPTVRESLTTASAPRSETSNQSPPQAISNSEQTDSANLNANTQQSGPNVSVLSEIKVSDSTTSVEICKIPDGRPKEMSVLLPGLKYLGQFGMSNVGFPASPDLFPVVGDVNFIVVPVAFADLTEGRSDIDSYLSNQTSKMTEWSSFWSQGQMSYSFQLVKGWRQLPYSSQKYAVDDRSRGQRTASSHAGLGQDIVDMLGNEVDWSKAVGIFAQFPQGFEAYQDEWASRSDTLNTPSGPKQFFLRGGGVFHLTNTPGHPLSDKQDKLWSYWIHEILHSQSMNVHAPGNGWPLSIGRNQYTVRGKFSGSVNSWESFKVGWIKDSQIFCIDGRENFDKAISSITPLEIYGGSHKLIVIRTGEHSGIGIESRRPVGYTQWSAKDSGLLVYSIDTTVMNDRSGESSGDCGNNLAYPKWGYLLAPEGVDVGNNPCSFEPFVVKEGKSVVVEDIRITLERSEEGLDYVSIIK